MATRNNNTQEPQDTKRHGILQELRRRGVVNRFSLSKALGVSNSRVCGLVDDMLKEGLVHESIAGKDRRGRGGAPVSLNDDFGQFLGFDMEARRLRLVIEDFSGNTLTEFTKPINPTDNRQDASEQIFEFIDTSVKKAGKKCSNILGLGLAASGVVDIVSGTILHYDLWPAVDHLPLRDLVAAHTGLPCVMIDNVQALTLAEWTKGAAQELDSFICVAMRSGIGAGIVINGVLHTGCHGFAGEVGYMPVGGIMAHTAKPLQQVASETALKVDPDKGDIKLNDSKARRTGELFGLQLSGITSLLDPQAIVLAGALLASDGPLWDHIVRAFKRTVLPELADRVQLLPARLGPYAGAHGAAYRCFQMRYPNGT